MANVIGEFVAKIGADMAGFEKGIDSADKKMGGFASNFAKHRKAIGMGMTAMGGAIVAGLGLAVKSAADFEAGMREVNTMMGLGQVEFETFSKDVLQLSNDMGINAVESTKALYQAISAGVPKENVLTFMEVASKAAIGGVTDTETAVDGLTTVLNAFKIPMEDAQKVADIMFTTVKGGKTTFEELAASMFQVAPIASASGISFDEVSAALATMTKQGFPTAQATTAIRQAIVQLQKPTADMTKMLDSLGYESGEAMIAELGFGKALDTLREATGGSNEMLMKMFGSVEAGGAVLALTGENAKTYTADLNAMKHASDGAGASQEAFNEIEKGAARQFEKAKESIKAVAIEIGGTLLPQLTPLIEQVGAVVGKVSAWMSANPELTGTIVKVIAVVGGLLVVIGPLLLVLPTIISLMPILGAAFAALLGPVGLVILAVGAWTAAGIALYQNWDIIMTGIEVLTARVVNNIVGFINNMIDAINLLPGVDIGKIGLMAEPTIKVTGVSQKTRDIQAETPPKMHGGGIVPGRPGQEVPILAEAGEIVSPVVGAGGITIIQNIEGSVISERELGEIAQRELVRLGRLDYTAGIP